MRIDKFLWCTRYFKSRSMASEACRKGHVKLRGKSIKPSHEVYAQDHLIVRKNQINYELLILDTPSSRVGASLVDIYRKDQTPTDAFKSQEMLKSASEHYRLKGLGRPTKKDRRTLDDYNDQID